MAYSNTTPITSSDDGSSNSGVIAAIVISLVVFIIVLLIIVIVVIVVVWKRKRSGSTKPEGVYYSTIGEGTLQASLPNKPKPIYAEMNDEQKNARNISNTSTTQQYVTIQDNPAYSEPKEQVALQDNPAYSDPKE